MSRSDYQSLAEHLRGFDRYQSYGEARTPAKLYILAISGHGNYWRMGIIQVSVALVEEARRPIGVQGVWEGTFNGSRYPITVWLLRGVVLWSAWFE